MHGELTKCSFKQVYEKYKDGFMLSGLIKICFANLASEKDYEETAAFFKVPFNIAHQCMGLTVDAEQRYRQVHARSAANP